MEQSKLFSLNWGDAVKGLIMAAGGGLMAVVVTSVNSGSFDFNWTSLWHGALIGAVPYIVKNYFSPPASTSDSPAAK